MKKLLASIPMVLVSLSAAAAQTSVEFGPYLNCVVINDASFPILIMRTNYSVTGAYGPAGQSLQCVSGCIIPPGGTAKMSGPPNDPNISNASCNVIFKPY
jgi:hypothetical protein